MPRIEDNLTAVEVYIRSIKNIDKKEYGWKYLSYLRHGGVPPDFPHLSYMAKQAVRLRIAEICGGAF